MAIGGAYRFTAIGVIPIVAVMAFNISVGLFLWCRAFLSQRILLLLLQLELNATQFAWLRSAMLPSPVCPELIRKANGNPQRRDQTYCPRFNCHERSKRREMYHKMEIWKLDGFQCI